MTKLLSTEGIGEEDKEFLYNTAHLIIDEVKKYCFSKSEFEGTRLLAFHLLMKVLADSLLRALREMDIKDVINSTVRKINE
jgi:hypothetical protein